MSTASSIGYVMARFPVLSETFIQREIRELRQCGIRVAVFSLRAGKGTPASEQGRDPAQDVRYARDPGAPACREPGSAALVRGACIEMLRRYWFAPKEWIRGARWARAAVGFAANGATLCLTHVHSHFAFVNADVGRIVARRLRLPFTVAVHARDIFVQSRAVLRARLRDADRVVTCTDYARDCVQRILAGCAAERVIAVRHGLNPQEFSPGEGKGEIILAVGRLERKKGLEYLLGACRKLVERGLRFRCVIVGEGPERERLEALRISWRLQNLVEFRGALSQGELLPLYREDARLLVLPCTVAPDGDRDNFPNVLAEAMACGLPVVSTTVAGIPEAVCDGISGYLVAPGDVAALADRIEQLLKDRALGRQMGEMGRAWVLEHFDIRRNVRALAQALDWRMGKDGAL